MAGRYYKRYAKSLLGLLQSLPQDTQDHVLRQAGLSRQELMDPERLISCSQEIMVLRSLNNLPDSDGLGMRLGASLTPLTLGAVGYAQMACRNARESIELVRRYRCLVIPYMRWDTLVVGDEVVHRITDVDGFGDLMPFIMEFALALIQCQSIALMGKECQPTSVCFSFTKPECVEVYRDHFCVTPRFNQRATEISFPIRYLDCERDSYDPMVKATMEQLCQSMASHLMQKVDVVLEVLSVLRSSHHGFPSMSEAANSLGISMRTLRRHLREQDSSYRELTDQVRQERAINGLQNQDLSLAHIAELCGFKELHSFYSAFKRWTGTSPASYRSGLAS